VRLLFVASLHHPSVPGPGSGEEAAEPLSFPSSQGYHFWVNSLTKMGHTCDVFWRSTSRWPWARPRSQHMTEKPSVARVLHALAASLPWIDPDVLWRNRRLLQHARAFRPDVLVLIGGNEVILVETLAAIKRELRSFVVYTCGTSPIVFSHSIERRAARLYDLVVSNDKYHAIQWLELGAPRAEVLPLAGVDPDFHRHHDSVDSETALDSCDVGFVGTLVPSRLYSGRIAALEALAEFDLAIWSVHEVPDSLRPAHRGPALGERMVQAMSASKIVVNPHGDFMRYGGNMRLFETCGAGVLQIVDDVPAVHEWFRVGTDLVTYRDPEDLRRKVAYYLSHEMERRQISASGQRHVYAHHTYDQRMARLIDLIHAAEMTR